MSNSNLVTTEWSEDPHLESHRIIRLSSRSEEKACPGDVKRNAKTIWTAEFIYHSFNRPTLVGS